MKKGLTFIEVLAVMAVTAIIVGVTLPKMKGMKDAANISKVETELKLIQLALTSYYTHHTQQYPPVSATLQADYLITAVPAIFKIVMPDPFSLTVAEYQYALSPNLKYYVVWSVGINNRSEITGPDNSGVVTNPGDDICITNGPTGCLFSGSGVAHACGDTSADPLNCGACGVSCFGGLCSSGHCININNDRNNCGGVGQACGNGEMCCGQVCTVTSSC